MQLKNNECIVLITKDRPTILSKTIQQLLDTDIKLILLDDSVTQDTKKLFTNYYKMNNVFYHGRDEQNQIFQKLRNLRINSFVKPLGLAGWNLGFIRNYALMLSKGLGYNKVLFMDDDIVVKDINIIKIMLKKLDSADFVGAKITGMPDDSIVGHLMRACGGEYYEFLCGGFLAIDLNSVSEYFLNYYNEDQIWLFLHKPTVRFETYGEVEQQGQLTFRNAKVKALKQEFGEILEEGVEEAFTRRDFTLLVKEDFWKEICDIRIDYLNSLQELPVGKKIESVATNVHKSLMDYHANVSYDTFTNVFDKYLNDLDLWRTTLNILGTDILFEDISNFNL